MATKIPSVETRIQQGSCQAFSAAAADGVAKSLGGSLMAIKDVLGSSNSAMGISTGTGNLSLGKTNGVPTDISGTSVTFVTTGRPVLLGLVQGNDNQPISIASAVTNVTVYLLRDGVEIARQALINAGSYTGCRQPWFRDMTAPAGSHTWKLQYSIPGTGASVFFYQYVYLFGIQI